MTDEKQFHVVVSPVSIRETMRRKNFLLTWLNTFAVKKKMKNNMTPLELRAVVWIIVIAWWTIADDSLSRWTWTTEMISITPSAKLNLSTMEGRLTYRWGVATPGENMQRKMIKMFTQFVLFVSYTQYEILCDILRTWCELNTHVSCLTQNIVSKWSLNN